MAFPLSDEERRARGRLVQAMLDVPWSVEDGGVPVAYSEDSRFAILNDMTAGEGEEQVVYTRRLWVGFSLCADPFSSQLCDHHAPPLLLLLTDCPLPLVASGQEEIDDIIKRDMHRTFPEHPLFSSEAGQGALFRVLKAYSLHDLEVLIF